MRRLISVACAVFLVGFLGCAAMPPATADGPPPPAFPSGLPSPGSVGNSTGGSTQAPQGPTYVVTPGSKGTALPPPTTVIPKPARARVRHVHPASTRSRSRTAVAAPAAAENTPTVGADGSEGKVLLAASGALLMLILTEFTRLDRRFRLHPPSGVR